MNYNEMQKQLKCRLNNDHRYVHSLSVSNTAVKLAKRFHISEEKAKVAGLLHDCAREIPTGSLIDEARIHHIKIYTIDEYQPILLHAPLGAAIAHEKYGITDSEILSAIALHTIGKAEMTDLDKIIYLADMVEPHRDYDGIDEFRSFMAVNDLNTIMIAAFDKSISFIIAKKQMIHPQTILARNFLLEQQKKYGK